METIINFLLFGFAVGAAQAEILLEPDRPFSRVQVHHRAELECCYSTNDNSVEPSWIKDTADESLGVPVKELAGHAARAAGRSDAFSSRLCSTLTFESVRLNNSGFYRCRLNAGDPKVVSHGTYLQVYKPMEKTINVSESTKNTILTVEGVLLLICVLVPSANLLRQSRRLHELEKKKALKEEENIYQGLNLDECWSAYDQIERCQAHGPYQDVGNIREEEEEMQLEKP
ncbi:B-cell antigen receptor complex-associated protein alpha chain [Spinachia spinachia]